MTAIERMYEAMDRRNMTPADMARALDISTSRLGNWKSRGSIPKAMLQPVSAVLNVNLEWLMTGKGNPWSGMIPMKVKKDIHGLKDFQQIVHAMEISVLGYNPPEILASIFHAALEKYLRTEEGRRSFSNYLSGLMIEKIGDQATAKQIRAAVEKSIDEVLDNRDHRQLHYMVAEPDKKY